MVSGEELARIGLRDLHYRWRELRDQLFMGDALLLCNHGKPIALIKPLRDRTRVPKDALVRNISYVHRHRREFTFELMDGNRIIFVYRGKKVALVDPKLPARLARLKLEGP
jgi:antitoxin (DNA-binding transcriptional repressor) of toxin-antitoxin stability system